ncbi:hypothetical protein C8R44DRAFT_884572 [Mycena epipterygia]|nr:hypothetical protein C8R44DRAFT_884572 [Mycena epipterygia]
MTPEETATLRDIGLELVKGFVAITNETLLLTIFGGLVFKATFILFDKEQWRNRSSLFTVLAILTMFAIAIVLWALDLANFIMEVKLTLIIDSDLSLDSRLGNALSFVFRLAAVQDALYSYMSLLGDAIVIWRIWSLKVYYRPWVLLFPISFLFGSLIATLMLTYCVAVVGSEIVLGTFQKPAFCRNVQTATYAMACATTAVATILIGLTTSNYRKSIKPTLRNTMVLSSGSKRQRRGQVESILLLLVESGVLYFLFFAIQVVGGIPRVQDWMNTEPGVAFAFTMYSYCSSVIVGIYPTLLVVLAHSHRGGFDDSPAAASTLRVAPPNNASGAWRPTLQLGTKRAEDEIELAGPRSSSQSEHREQHVKVSQSLEL